MTPKINSWHRRHAIMLASQLPDNSEDGLIILQLAREWTRMAAAAAGGVICGAAGVGKEAACRATPLSRQALQIALASAGVLPRQG
jgi:hypothetical protein